MKAKVNYYWLLSFIPLLFIAWYFISSSSSVPLRTLPYFGKKRTLKKGDTTYHTVKPFCFTNQFNNKVTERDVEDKIYVTDFFFTSCQSICPKMTTQLERVYTTFYGNDKVMILSHTVLPEEDSVTTLMNYAKLHGVKNKQWLFLTGDKPHLYDMARQGYLLNNEQGSGNEDDFIHTQNFALVDYQRHLRGFYDGTDSLDINRLLVDIKLLLQEYNYKKSKNK